MVDEDQPHELYTNGVHGRTGDYLVPPITLDEAANEAAKPDEDQTRAEVERKRWEDNQAKTMKIAPGVDETDLSEAGWGVIYNGAKEHTETVEEIRRQLAPLLERRKAQAQAKDKKLYQEYSGRKGYNGQSGTKWLEMHGVDLGTAFPEDMPAYLLIVGPPDQIPFEFQYIIDMQRAVGRLHFDDLEDYGRYAKSVVEYEEDGQRPSQGITFFGPKNRRDRATSMSSAHLVGGLTETLDSVNGWAVDSIVEGEATKRNLVQLMEDAPAILFAASHGVGFDPGDDLQLSDQGALLCQEWERGDAVTPKKYFSAADVPADASLAGRMAFMFACYGGGTPQTDDFSHRISPTARREIADHAFLAALPQRLLANPGGGMLAVAAHVDRAWSFSFFWGRARRQIRTFEATLREIMSGRPIGLAFDHINVKAGTMAVPQAAALAKALNDPSSLARAVGTWTAAIDARNYVIIGDPATRLAVD